MAILVVILGSAARVVRWFTDRPLWLDEQMIAINLRDRSFAALAADLSHDQSAPIGWLWAQRAVFLTLGDDGRALRLIPLLFGVGTLVLAYWAGRRLLGPAGTLVLVTLLAVNGSLMRYSTEIKQYSADAFTVLLLLTLALLGAHRAWLWWLAAAVSGLFSTAAIMVTPGLALVLVIVSIRSAGWLGAIRQHAAGVAVFAAALIAHYVLALKYALGDDTLAALNARLGFPPPGVRGTVTWLIERPATLAGDPIGVRVELAAVIWLLALIGIVAAAWWPRGTSPASAPAALASASAPASAGASLSTVPGWTAGPRWVRGLLLAAPIATAFAAAVAHAVPLYGRFAIQLLPPLFVAAAIAADLIVFTLLTAARRPARLIPASVGAVGIAALAAFGIAPAAAAAAGPAPYTNGFDDRAAVQAIVAAHRPGDLVLANPSAWPAVKWYAGPALGPVGVLENNCRHNPIADAARGYHRILVYAGMQAGGTDTEKVIAERLAALGTVSSPERFRSGAVYTVTLSADIARSQTPVIGKATGDACLTVSAAR
ncbi:glycosyltransferase family protein [Catenuloplanes japonicus]|uniref:glycosyltransferase family 39 protein n=1 Tax=Catenuloplanes japonicus TaxID=33876 RepID=UPI0005274191|nr:glycosyltransferase family 39 protein [Catenuloplanes japonicus]